MKTKEAIEFIEEVINIGIPVIQGEKVKFGKIIELLKRGEKFEKMWKNLKWIFEIPIASINGKFILKGIKKLELKYFLKEE